MIAEIVERSLLHKVFFMRQEQLKATWKNMIFLSEKVNFTWQASAQHIRKPKNQIYEKGIVEFVFD